MTKKIIAASVIAVGTALVFLYPSGISKARLPCSDVSLGLEETLIDCCDSISAWGYVTNDSEDDDYVCIQIDRNNTVNTKNETIWVNGTPGGNWCGYEEDGADPMWSYDAEREQWNSYSITVLYIWPCNSGDDRVCPYWPQTCQCP